MCRILQNSITLMSNYKNTKKKNTNVIFSFSHSKTNSGEMSGGRTILTAADQRGLYGWIATMLQPFGKEFMHALEKSEKRGIVNLCSYMVHNYPHLKEIVRYYITTLLIDVGWTDWQSNAQGKLADDALLNILIEELGCRFYRESQWLTKIMHIPTYQLFATLDSFSKGYITMRELAALSKHEANFQAEGQWVVEKKLKGNLGGLLPRIYQQNLKELQLRVDLTSFSNSHLSKGQECSQAYSKIYSILNDWSKAYESNRLRLEYNQLQKSRKILEELELNREDFRIRSISKSLLESSKRAKLSPHANIQYKGLNRMEHQEHKHADHKEHISIKNEEIDESVLHSNPSKHLSQTKAELEPKITFENIINDSKSIYTPKKLLQSQKKEQSEKKVSAQESKKADIVRPPASVKPIDATLSLSIQAQVEAARNLQFLREQQFEAIHHEKLLVKAAILSELQHIKFTKFHNRHRLYTYI